MTRNYIFAHLLSIGMLASAGACTTAQNAKPIELTFGTLTGDGMVEQDVFVASPVNANEVIRLPAAQADSHMEAMLFASAEAPPFEPMNLEPTGSYQKGPALRFTLGDWLKATGSGSYSCDGQKATIMASFQNLVPNGVYTMWNFIDADPPTDPWQGLVWPLGERDGSQGIFNADTQGNATFEQVVEPCPQLSATQSLAGLAIAWHSDGQTYGFSPGGLGVVTHAQLMTILPHAGGTQ